MGHTRCVLEATLDSVGWNKRHPRTLTQLWYISNKCTQIKCINKSNMTNNLSHLHLEKEGSTDPSNQSRPDLLKTHDWQAKVRTAHREAENGTDACALYI